MPVQVLRRAHRHTRSMRAFLLLLPVVIPVLLWAAYHWHKDRRRPEPPGNLLLCFVAGIAAFFLGKYAYVALGVVGLRFDAYALAAGNLGHLFAYAVLVIGGIEESVKLLTFMLITLRFRAFDESVDGIVYASFIALGFAAAENVHYLEFLSRDERIYRGFAGPLVHIVFASVWGYYTGAAWLAGKRLALTAFLSVTAAALLHGVYDFVVIAFPATALPASAALIVAVWLWRLLLIRRLQLAADHPT
jgi:RsiW-degrading membrane proteinase PrsW (M82 family)